MRRPGGAMRFACALAVLLAVSACGNATAVQAGVSAVPTPTLPPEDVVDLTIYLRRGEGEAAGLVPVTRQVPITDDLPRVALELLLSGPGPGDDPALAAPLPSGVEIRDLQIASGSAEIDLSEALLVQARQVLREPADELLALAAIANTMTEFPEIDEVRLRIAGHSSGSLNGHDVAEFWGYWGLPSVLVRDESVILTDATGTREPLLDFTELRQEPQEVGVAGAGPVSIPSIRVEERICSMRLVVNLAEPGTAAVAAAAPVVPASRVIPVGDDLVLQMAGVVLDGAMPGDLAETLEPAGIERIALDTATPGNLRIRIQRAGDGVEPPRVWLHALQAPPRIVLDIQK